MIVTKDNYTDQFFQARRSKPMSLAAEIQWTLGDSTGWTGGP